MQEATAVMALKDFKFRVEINGLECALVQEFDPGARTHGVSEHAGGGQNFVVKEAGMIKYADAVLKMVVPVEGPGKRYFDEWMNQAQDPATGNGLSRKEYQRNFSVFELDNDGAPVRVWEYYMAFPSHHNPGNRSALSIDKNVIEEIHITYSYRKMRSFND
ncbi:MAG: phage tail protein [bacterium]